MEATSVVLTRNGLVRIEPPDPNFCARGLGGDGHQKALDIAVRSRSPHPRAGTPIEGDELLKVNGGFLPITGGKSLDQGIYAIVRSRKRPSTKDSPLRPRPAPDPAVRSPGPTNPA